LLVVGLYTTKTLEQSQHVAQLVGGYVEVCEEGIRAEELNEVRSCIKRRGGCGGWLPLAGLSFVGFRLLRFL
jgi:hypothetical protein